MLKENNCCGREFVVLEKLNLMALNIPSRNTDYDEITEFSTYEDKLNVVFNVLRKSYSPIWLEYYKLKIPNSDEKLFNAKLKATGFVDYKQGPTAYNPDFKLNDKGYLMLEEYGSYAKYLQKIKSDQDSETEMDENAIKNNVLKQLNTKEVGIPYYFEQLSIDTGFDNDIIHACCLEFDKLGYVSMTQQEASMLSAGKLFIKTGGYKKDNSFAVKVDQIGHRYTTIGDQSPIAAHDVTQSFKEIEESPESIELKAAQMENTRLSSELLKLQIKEAKAKKKFAILGAIGGAILTYVSTHARAIWEFIRSIFVTSN